MACLASPLTSLVASQKQEAGREGGGEGEEDRPAEHWWLPLGPFLVWGPRLLSNENID